MLEALGVSSAGDIEYLSLGEFNKLVSTSLLAVSLVGDVRAGGDKVAQNALLLYYRSVVLYVERVRNCLIERADVILTARFGVYALGNEHIDKRYDIYLLVDKE